MLHDADRRERMDAMLLRRYHDHHDLRARDELAQRCAPLVKSIARKYQGRGEDHDDLLQAGYVGLVKAIDRFDPDAGHRFVSFAVPTITGEIRRHFRDTTWAVRVPRALKELDADVEHARRDLLAVLGRDPSEDDIAEQLDIDVEDVRLGRRIGRAYRSVPLERPSAEDGSPLDVHGERDPGYARVEARCVTDDALRALDDRERQVVRWRYDEDLLQREIAERIGLSQMQVSRILHSATERMHDRVTRDARTRRESVPTAA